jgi:hypothetical protein
VAQEAHTLMSHFDVSLLNMVSQEMVSHFDVFGSPAENWVMG